MENESGIEEDFFTGIEYQGPKFTGRLEALQANLAEARRQHAAGELSALDVLDAEEQLREFGGEHDNAGAYKSERLGADLARALEERDGGLELNAHGVLIPTEQDERSHVFMISITELDRINDEGGHEAGNKALSETVKAVEQAVRNRLLDAGITEPDALSAAYDIYRLRGSDFIVRLKTPTGGSESDRIAEQITQKVIDGAPEVVKGKERPPLTAVSIRQDRAIEMFNRIQSHLAPDHRVAGKDATRMLIDITKRAPEFQSEVSRLLTNATRVFEKKARGDAEAEPFFAKYIAKGFEGTALANFEDFDPTESRERFENKAADIAFALVVDQFARERQTADAAEGAMLDAVVGRELTLPERFSETERAKLKELPTVSSAELAKRQARTQGNNELNAFKRQLESATTDPTQTDKARQVVERYGELPKGVVVDYQNPAEVQKALGLVERKFRVEQNRYDRLTGLPNRGEFYGRIKEMHREAEKNGGEVRMFFIDLAFLKYFNQQGGREVGNVAIQNAAELMEEAIKRAGLEGRAQAYRYAGDEFTILFNGTEQEEQTLSEAVETVRRARGGIERSEKSTDLYRPEALQFNTGSADRTDSQNVIAELIRLGVVDKTKFESDERYRIDQLVDIQTKLADLSITADKAFTRFDFLFSKLAEPAFQQTHSIERAQTEMLVKYSKKAVFGMNVEELITLHEQVKAGRVDLREFVSQKIEAKQEANKDQREITDLVIESFVREGHLRERITRLEGQLAEESHENEILKKQMADLNARLQGILDARGAIGKG